MGRPLATVLTDGRQFESRNLNNENSMNNLVIVFVVTSVLRIRL